jgi:hypothetical protein
MEKARAEFENLLLLLIKFVNFNLTYYRIKKQNTVKHLNNYVFLPIIYNCFICSKGLFKI